MEFPKHLVTLALVAAWAAAPQGAARADAPARGQQIYKLCEQCHGVAGEGSSLALAPEIAGLPEWYVAAQLRNFKGGLRGMHPGDVAGLRMYPMSLTLKTDADIQAVAAYVASLPPLRPEPTLSGGDPARGAAIYATCAACHGPDGGGNQALNAPPLNHQADWYLLSSLQKFKAGVRGGDPRNANAVLMRSFSNALADEQAMKDVIAHIETLRSQAAANPPAAQ
jgi:cytochrome c553